MTSPALVTGSFRDAIGSKAARQVMLLFGSQVLFLLGGILANVFNTRALGPTQFGNYSFAFALTEYVILFIDFGFYSSGARVLALEQREQTQRRQLIGALILIGSLLSLFAGLLIFGVSFFAATLLRSTIGPTMRLYSALFGLMGLQMLVEAVCRGENKIGALSLFRVAIKAVNVLLIVVFLWAGAYTFSVALLVNLLAYVAAAAVLLAWVKPLFTGVRQSFSLLLADVKTYGWNAYLGNIANTASAKTDSMLISAFSDPANVGYYNLGSLLTFPMATFSRSVSTTLFKGFTRQGRIPRIVIQVNLAWLVTCAVGLIALRKPLVHLLFGPRYAAVIPLILPLAITSVFAGLAQPYNMFMGAKGKGTYLRNTALMMAALNLSLNVLLIPRFKALGACYATLFALTVNLVLHLFYYKKTVEQVAAAASHEAEGQG